MNDAELDELTPDAPRSGVDVRILLLAGAVVGLAAVVAIAIKRGGPGTAGRPVEVDTERVLAAIGQRFDTAAENIDALRAQVALLNGRVDALEYRPVDPPRMNGNADELPVPVPADPFAEPEPPPPPAAVSTRDDSI